MNVYVHLETQNIYLEFKYLGFWNPKSFQPYIQMYV